MRVSMMTLLVTGAFLMSVFFCGSFLFMWVKRRACAYHVDTGYWALLILACLSMAVALMSELLMQSSPLALYVQAGLKLLSFLMLLTALLRLFAWKPHRHALSP
jgi:hypothetical protein